MKLAVYNQDGKELETVEVSSALFDVPMNPDTLHQVIESQSANSRVVRAATKSRGEVRGGGKKPWRQKGTGRARHGSIRSPLWKGGGVTHGPLRERNFSKKINKKMATKALAMAISAKARDGEVVVLNSLSLDEGKTKKAVLVMKNLASNKSLATLLSKSVSVVLPASPIEERAFRNMGNVVVRPASGLTAREALASKFLILPKSSVDILEKRVGSKS